MDVARLTIRQLCHTNAVATPPFAYSSPTVVGVLYLCTWLLVFFDVRLPYPILSKPLEIFMLSHVYSGTTASQFPHTLSIFPLYMQRQQPVSVHLVPSVRHKNLDNFSLSYSSLFLSGARRHQLLIRSRQSFDRTFEPASLQRGGQCFTECRHHTRSSGVHPCILRKLWIQRSVLFMGMNYDKDEQGPKVFKHFFAENYVRISADFQT